MTKLAGQESLTSSVRGLQSVVVSEMHIQRHTTVHHFTRSLARGTSWFRSVYIGNRLSTIINIIIIINIIAFSYISVPSPFPLLRSLRTTLYILFTDITITNENDMKISINK